MYGKISIYLTTFIVLVLPSIFVILKMLKSFRPIKETIVIIQKIMVFPVFSIPFLSLAIIILGYLSKSNNEGYGTFLNLSIGFGILVMIIVFIIIAMYFKGGFSLGGTR